MIWICVCVLLLAFGALASARRERCERQRWQDRFRKLREAAFYAAERADREIAGLRAENDALRAQLRRRGIIIESAFASAKRFQRARFDRGIEILRHASLAQNDRR